MDPLSLEMTRIILVILASFGVVFHLLVLRSPQSGEKMEEKLGAEFGVKKKFVPWLENTKLGLHQRLINSRLYNVFAVLFLVILLILLLQL